MKKQTLILGLMVILLMPLTAEQQVTEPLQAEPFEVEEIAFRAQSRNPQVLKALRSLKNAEEALTGESRLLDSRLTLEGAYGPTQNQTGPSADSGDNVVSAQASISVPLLEQLAIGGGITAREGQAIEGELSLSVSPFIAGDPTYSEEEAYGKALIAWRVLRQQTYFDAEQAVLGVLIGEMERELAGMTLELEQKRYDTVQKEIELGEASFEALQDRLRELTDARKNLYTVESQALSSWKELQLLFDPDNGEVNPSPLSLERLEQLIRNRETRLAAAAAAAPSSATLETLKLELSALQAELKATSLWRPDFNLSGSVGLPDLSTYSLSASLSFSPNDIKNDEREDLQEAIDEKLLDIRSERFDLSLQKQLTEQSIAIAEQAFEAATVARQQASLTLEESELLYQQGELTIYELEQAELSLKSAEIDAFSAAVDLYQAQAQLLMLYAASEK